MIVDTSAWIEFLRGTGSRAHLALRAALREAQPIWVPLVVLQEILQGARDPQDYLRLRSRLESLPSFEPESAQDLHEQAALLYARCRWRGLTPRSPIDCIVAACAIQADLPLLAMDRDFTAIASIEPRLKLVP